MEKDKKSGINTNEAAEKTAVDNDGQQGEKNRIAEIFYILTKILRAFAVAGMILYTLFVIIILIFGKTAVYDAGTNEIARGFINIHLESREALINADTLVLSMASEQLSGAVISAFIWFVCQSVLKILRPGREGGSFTGNAAGQLKKLGFAVLLCGVLIELIKLLSSYLTYISYDFMKLFSTGAVNDVTFHPEINPSSYILLGAVLLLLAYIFGYENSKDTDEKQ